MLHRRLSIARGLDRGETLCYLGIEGDALARSIEWLLRIWVAIVRWPLGGPRKNVHSVESTAPGTTWSGAVHNTIDLSAAPGRVPRGFYCASPPMMRVMMMAMTDLTTSKARSLNDPCVLLPRTKIGSHLEGLGFALLSHQDLVVRATSFI